MRITSYILILLVCLSTTVYSNDIKISEESNSIKVIDKSSVNFKLITSINKISTNVIKTKFGDFVKLSIPLYTSNSIDGNPELPSLNKLISVPKGAKVVTKIINKIVKTVSLEDYGIELPLFPNQPSISKGDNPENIDFIFNKDSYSQNSFSQSNIVSTELLGFMRDIQLARISVSPISYNPITNELKIITNLEIEFSFIDIDFAADKLSKQKYYSADFDHLYKKCINYLPSNTKDVITTYPVKYVIVSDPIFQTALQPLIDWKTKKGFSVIEAYTNDPNVGTTTTSIKSYLQNMYDSATINNPAPTYLLIVGDDTQVPSFVGAQHVSDMYYCEFDGNGDFYPEMYFGRFSANTVSEVEIQVAKTLTHEKYLFSDPSFLNNIVLVAGVDASYAPTYGNGQINYATDNYFNIAHNLTIHNYLYGSGTPITSDMSQASASIISNVDEGVGLANYSAHCGPSGWSDPSFNSSDVSGLQNIDEYAYLSC